MELEGWDQVWNFGRTRFYIVTDAVHIIYVLYVRIGTTEVPLLTTQDLEQLEGTTTKKICDI